MPTCPKISCLTQSPNHDLRIRMKSITCLAYVWGKSFSDAHTPTLYDRKAISVGWIRVGWVALGLAWFGLAWLGLTWLGLAWLGLAWLGLAWLGLAWLGLAWLGLAWLALGLGSVGYGWVRLGLSSFPLTHTVGNTYKHTPAQLPSESYGISSITCFQTLTAPLTPARLFLRLSARCWFPLGAACGSIPEQNAVSMVDAFLFIVRTAPPFCGAFFVALCFAAVLLDAAARAPLALCSFPVFIFVVCIWHFVTCFFAAVCCIHV